MKQHWTHAGDFMERLIAGGLAASLFAFATVSAAQEDAPENYIVISSGAEGGGYWSAGDRLREVAEGMDLRVENRASTGSLDNLEQLLDPANPVSMAFAQADAAEHFYNQHPDARAQVDVIENIGLECVFVLASTGSDLETDGDLQERAEDLKLGIKSETSGIAVTFEYMSSLVPELAAMEVVYGDPGADMEGLDREGGAVDAVMVVHRPKEHSPEVDFAIANPDRVAFVALEDDRLTEEIPGGNAVYRSMRLALPGAKDPVDTICVRGLLLGNKEKLTSYQRDKLTDLVNYHWMRVYATQ